MINRRSLLKSGMAVPLALRSLQGQSVQSLQSSQQVDSPRRIIFICNSLGFYAPYFFPKKKGDLKSSEYLAQLELPEKLTLFERLFHPGMETSNHDSEKSFLTGAPNPEATGFINRLSVDQKLARQIGKPTRFPYLSFSIYDRGWGCSWNDRGAAIPPMHDEKKIFDLLFAPDDLASRKKKLNEDRLVLDSLREELKQLETDVSARSRARYYRTLIDELQAKLDRDLFWLKTSKPKVEYSLKEDPQFQFSAKIQNLFDLATLAFRTDSTRVITFSMDWIYGAIKVPGATGGWHTLSHHGGQAKALSELKCIELDILKHFNRFLSALDGIKEGKGTLLDHTTVVFGSNFGDASNHTCSNLPIIVAGGGHRYQQHLPLDQPIPLCNLWLELLQDHDIDTDQFGSSDKNAARLLI